MTSFFTSIDFCEFFLYLLFLLFYGIDQASNPIRLRSYDHVKLSLIIVSGNYFLNRDDTAMVDYGFIDAPKPSARNGTAAPQAVTTKDSSNHNSSHSRGNVNERQGRSSLLKKLSRILDPLRKIDSEDALHP